MAGIVRESLAETSGKNTDQRFSDAYNAALSRKRLFKVTYFGTHA